MQSPSASSTSSTLASGAARRVHYRHQIHSLVYVNLDQGNGGIVRNLSQNGAAVQAVGALHPHQFIRVRFDLLHPRTRVEARAQVAWATPTGQAGLRFVEMAPQTRRQLNDWIFTSLLRGIEQASLVLAGQNQEDDLILSSSARPPIRLPHPGQGEAAEDRPHDDSLVLPWWPVPIAPRTLATLLDALVLFAAVMTFFCVFFVIVKALPPWPLALGLVFGVSGCFTALYWYLFGVMGRGTPGLLLARTAIGAESEEKLREGEARFR